MSTNEDVKVKLENDIKIKEERKDPTCFLPEEPMTYEIKKKKKKKKRKKNKERDPFRDLAVKNDELTLEMQLDPEVNIKVENIEVELDFNDFANNDDGSLMVEGPQSEESQEPAVKIEDQNHEAVLLTFESVVNKTLLEYSENLRYDDEGNIIGFEQQDASVLGYSQGITMATAPTHLCKVCHLVFQSHKTLRMHQKRKHKAYRKYFQHVCDHCGMSYEQKNSLVAHIKRKHGPDAAPDDREERTCEVCALVFKGNTRLRMHMRRKHGSFQESFKYSCEQCGLTYDKQRSLVVHQQRKHSVIQKPVLNQWFNCPFCPKIFTRRETYSRHVQRKHKILDKDEIKEEFVNVKNEETGEITCKQCPLVFSSVNFLKLHMRRKHNALTEDFRLKCRICNLSYDKIESLKRHVRRKHGNNSHCEVCNKEFVSREAYLNHSHVKTHSECEICGLIFASEGNLGKHMRLTHKIDTPKHVFCNVCNEGFFDKRQLKSHLLKVHLKVSYTCKYCSKVFKAKESYRRHILFKHPESNILKNQVQNCEQCSATFPDEFELCRHINSEHRNDQKEMKEELVLVKEENCDKSFQCKKCPESYTSWEQLRLHHEQNHHLPEETQCQVCGEMVPGNALKKHIRNIHIEEPQCKYCEFKTNNRASMTQHILRHKNVTTLHCDYTGCRYKTYYEGAMLRHKRKHAEIGVKLQCTKCPFQTMNKYILKYHEEAHMTGKKRYVCDQCDYATILPANLVQHKYKHSAEKRFKCEVCPFATKYNTSLRFHVKKKHCDLPSLS